MVREDKEAWKSNYFLRMVQLLDEYPKCFIVGVDNVSSKQIQQIRQALRDSAQILMGKNTLMRKGIKGQIESNPGLDKLLPHIKGNVGIVFTREDLSEIREKILSNKVAAPARAGAIAPLDVKLPPQNTGLGPEKTSFFQALSIPTKITKGTIEILNEIHLIKKDAKVGASEATLLNMLGISPFTYGFMIKQVYDSGTTFSPNILDITPADLRKKFLAGVKNVATVSLAIGYPTAASAPHLIVNAVKDIIAIACETDISFPAAEMAKEYLKDPSKFAAVAAAAPAASGSPAKGAAKKEEKKEESEEEDDDMGFGLFD